ncbi:MAG TPA: CapA family protein [Acidimicrobiales bacterium]
MRRKHRTSLALTVVAVGATISVLAGPTAPPPASAASAAVRVDAFGRAPAFGAPPAGTRVAAIAPTPTGNGYLVASREGRVFAYGDASHHGPPEGTGLTLNAPIVAIATTPTGRGYWLAATDGGIFTFGDAGFHGSTGSMTLNAPIVAIAATPTGGGYWLTATDGGIFTFGDAAFHGSTGSMTLNAPIVGMAATPTGRGYWLTATDGGIFTFGDAAFHGSTGSMTLNAPIVGMATTPTGRGYWLTATDGGIFTFGDAAFHGSAAGALADGTSAVGLAARPAGDGYWILSGPGDIRLLFAGDVHGERRIADLLARGDNPLSEVAPMFRAADAVAVNLETPVGAPGTPQQKQYVFLAPTSLLAALKSAGVDVISLANNHALDHGPAALLRTRQHARDAGLLAVGAGANAAEAYAPAFVGVAGRRIAYVGISRVVPPGWAATASRPGVASAYDERATMAAVQNAAARADAVVVLVHWGTELARCADGAQAGLARRLQANGATLVVGHHPHVLQGFEHGGGVATAYSLGNFVWYHSDPPSDRTAVFEAVVDGDRVRSALVHPATVGNDGRPRVVGAATAPPSGPCA